MMLATRLSAATCTVSNLNPSPVCWPCLLLVGIVVPDEINFGMDGRDCPPGRWLCNIQWISGGGQGPFENDPERYAVGATSAGDFGIYIPDITKCPSIEGGMWMQGTEFSIPASIASALRIQPYTLKKGNYDLQRNGNKAAVIFKK